jgi:hypothetical protein
MSSHQLTGLGTAVIGGLPARRVALGKCRPARFPDPHKRKIPS